VSLLTETVVAMRPASAEAMAAAHLQEGATFDSAGVTDAA